MAGPVTAFLEGEGMDARGRSIFDVLGMDNVALERTHDFIQWLFPLPEPSAAVPAATDRMEAFYRGTRDWLRPHDHNHLRITRIIRSLRLLRGDGEADAFRDAILFLVEAARAPVSARSRGYWTTA